MKFQPDTISVPSISGYGPGWIGIGNEKITRSVVIGSGGERFDWLCSHFSDLNVSHFAQLADLNAELIIFGSGERIRFPRPAWIKPLIDKQTGIETMDTQAACRTYNILAGEGRRVVVALLLEDSPG
ncbi:Mth938-like domain-containing protein [Rhodoferax sp.]|uniref:Mth938-like domain-containing protein n=1 Tax=Rhodoferax sp. TaxID=50421 RepID=UPI001EC9D482|nr:Mth938-like domain-containing protein [Rhodoferax sp.]MBT9508537.1 Mth938-like domain-containing protein [Rhodoferax sp.]